ncbi:MAG TPA: EscS/YscS/HrcS family type III secretion system export apparatus protein [Gammaproteobacteria bacterium]|jgi:type III secretion protein S|nr:EscS/YscS/HrcS family type III secretion system export apparatus protein [Gammaproteobacteria bacterium]
MGETELIHFSYQAMMLVLMLSMPVLITATVIGILVGLFQALTQIQDQTLPFGLKLIGVIVIMALTARWVGIELHRFTINLFETIPTLSL